MVAYVCGGVAVLERACLQVALACCSCSCCQQLVCTVKHHQCFNAGLPAVKVVVCMCVLYVFNTFNT
jgi:hypothetical protein